MVLKELLVVILLLFCCCCCDIPGSTPFGVLLLNKALLLSEDCGTILEAVERTLVPIPTAVVSKGLEAVDISGVDEAEKSSPGCDDLNVPGGLPSGLPFCLEAFLCKVVLKCLFR